MVDYAAALRDGCKESPRAVVERTEVEEIVVSMCKSATEEAAKFFQLPDGRGQAITLVHLTHTEEKAQFAPTCSIPEQHGRVYIMHGEWERVRDIPAVHGIELLTYRRGPFGYPAKVASFDGTDALCPTRAMLEATLANILRSPHTGARIRHTAKAYASRPTET